MELFLTRLQEMHPELSPSMAWHYWHHAAIGLTRHHARSGVNLKVVLDNLAQGGRIHWLDPSEGDQIRQKRDDVIYLDSRRMFDYDRVTEEAAEAIALAMVRVTKGWTIRRRMRRHERADWLLEDAGGNRIALEVSGVNAEDTGARRLRKKLAQVRGCRGVDIKVACVVELRPPRVRMKVD